jgi:hypothetical protein
MLAGPSVVRSRSTGARPRLLLALTLASAAVVAFSPGPAGAEANEAGETVIGAAGETSPVRLPRSHTVPARLKLGFTSATVGTATTPELTAIRIELARSVELQTAGLPSCPISELYSESSDAQRVCAGSVVGSGTVVSEVTIPGQAPVTIEGRLTAFYSFGEGAPRILAQVTSAGALPLTYVLPFTIESTRGAFGTTLSVKQMEFIAGICARGHPDCFSQTYTYKGIYGHISRFELTLDRRFVHAGRPASVVNAECPARGTSPSATFPLVKVDLTYPRFITLSQVATRRCAVAASPPVRGKRA